MQCGPNLQFKKYINKRQVSSEPVLVFCVGGVSISLLVQGVLSCSVKKSVTWLGIFFTLSNHHINTCHFTSIVLTAY